MPVNVWLVIGVLIVVVVRRVSPIIGGVLGSLAAVGIAVWGLRALDAGAAIALLGIEIGRNFFIGFVLVWFAFEVWGVHRAWKVRQRKREEAAAARAELAPEEQPVDGGSSPNSGAVSDG